MRPPCLPAASGSGRTVSWRPDRPRSPARRLPRSSTLALDALGLLGSPARAAPGAAGQKRASEPPAREERREELHRSDHVSFALLDHEGESVVDKVPLDKLWEAAAQGSHWAKSRANLSSDSEHRVGVGISQTAGALAVAVRKFRDDPHINAVVQQKRLENAVPEANA
ncbi:unnamed protein product [Prorocentrum cordatum]|uniref:Uncharacterized protein n=1 Tax=Prorocentrum cordatum TaxID=2364126 RepID=A0ABN9PF60_9DINO|nr:unnamed protein product [Polarella glacialis]